MEPRRIFRLVYSGEVVAWQRAGHSGHHYTKDKTRDFEAAVRNFAIAEIGWPLLEGPLRITLKIYFSPPKSWSKKKVLQAVRGNIRHAVKPDWDNVSKGVCDALNGVAWKDDSQICRAEVEKHYSLVPGFDLTIFELQAANDGADDLS